MFSSTIDDIDSLVCIIYSYSNRMSQLPHTRQERTQPTQDIELSLVVGANGVTSRSGHVGEAFPLILLDLRRRGSASHGHLRFCSGVSACDL